MGAGSVDGGTTTQRPAKQKPSSQQWACSEHGPFAGEQVIVPVQLPGGMQRELPLPKTQQTQPGRQATSTAWVARL
jgi:hypothetical protein